MKPVTTVMAALVAALACVLGSNAFVMPTGVPPGLAAGGGSKSMAAPVSQPAPSRSPGERQYPGF